MPNKSYFSDLKLIEIAKARLLDTNAFALEIASMDENTKARLAQHTATLLADKPFIR